MSMSTLHEASEEGDIERVRELVEEQGANVNATTRYGETSLHNASWKGHIAVVEYLVENGAGVNVRDNGGNTSLSWASHNGHLPVVQYLVQNGAEVNATRTNEETPLHFASSRGHLDIVQSLIIHGADVNARDNHIGWTPLHWASQRGHFEIVKHLIQEGANWNTTTENGRTPLDLAQEYHRTNSHAAVIQFLEERINAHKCHSLVLYLLSQGFWGEEKTTT